MEKSVSKEDYIDCNQAAALLKCSRPTIERYQVTGKLTPVPTVHPRYYFAKEQVLELKESLTSKTQSV